MDYIPVIDLAGIGDNKKPTTQPFSKDTTLPISEEDYPLWQNAAGDMRKVEWDWIHVFEESWDFTRSDGALLTVFAVNTQISAAFRASKDFFQLPDPVKSKYKKNPEISSHGWVQAGQELLHPNSVFELRECFDIAGNQRFYPTPEEHADFREIMEKLEKEGKLVMRKLLKLLGLSLELEDTDYFIKSCRHLDTDSNDPQNTITNECDLRAIYYPEVPDNLQVPPGTVRCAEHTDYEILTLLFQDDVGGLEVKDVNGKWIPATPIPNTILVNTGDLLQFWTNGYYPATLHRVVIPEQEIRKRVPRHSFAYFFAPDDHTLVGSLKSKFVPVRPSDERDKAQITAYEHIMNRVKSAYQY